MRRGFIGIVGCIAALFATTAVLVARADSDSFADEIRKENPDLVIEKVILEGDIPCYVVTMKDKAADVKPAVIVLHGHNAGKHQVFHWRWPQELAFKGYVVVTPDAWGHGERDSVSERRALEDANWMDGFTRTVQETSKDMGAVIDYLQTREDVDPDRIGLMGISLGGCETLATSVIEDRLAAYVVLEGGCDYLGALKEDLMRLAFPKEPEITDSLKERVEALDPFLNAEQIAPKPVVFIHGKHDRVLPPRSARAMHEKLAPLYKDHPDRLALREFDAYPLPTHREPTIREIIFTHYPTPGMTQAAYDWLDTFVRDRAQ